MNLLIELFLTFAKIGLFTFGGGYAMISMIENVCVENKKWISYDDMMNITVIANAFKGIKLAVGILILDAALKMIQKMPKKAISLVIMVCAATLMMITNISSLKFSSVTLVLAAGIVSLCVFKTKERKTGNLQ